jgi:hypothetical protein
VLCPTYLTDDPNGHAVTCTVPRLNDYLFQTSKLELYVYPFMIICNRL